MSIWGVAGIIYNHSILHIDFLWSVFGYSFVLVLGACCLLLSYRQHQGTKNVTLES